MLYTTSPRCGCTASVVLFCFVVVAKRAGPSSIQRQHTQGECSEQEQTDTGDGGATAGRGGGRRAREAALASCSCSWLLTAAPAGFAPTSLPL